MKGYVMQLQPFSVNDGEGIRTTIFMAVLCGVNGVPIRRALTKSPKRRFMKSFASVVDFVLPFVMFITESISMTRNSGKNVMDVASAPMSVRRMRKNAWLWKKRFLKLWKK